MRYSTKQYAQALYEAMHQAKDEDHDLILDRFANLLKQHGVLGRFAEIEEAYHQHDKSARGIKTVQVTTTRELGAAEGERIVEALNKYVGSNVELRQQVDERLLGGIVVRLDDEMIDASLKRNLQDIKNNLIQ